MKLPELKIPDSMKNMEPSSAPKIEDIQKVDFAEMKKSGKECNLEDTILAAVMTCNGCKETNAKEPAEDEGILEKADRLVSEKISVIHVGVCRLNEEKKECPRITQICGLIEERGIKVIRGTHKE